MALNYDPNNPVYPATTKVEMPTLEQPDATVSAKTGSSYIDPTKTSANIAAGLISSGSPFVEAAQADTRQQAANRGLINTTMATTAGTKAAIDSVQPYALQEGQLYGQAALNQQTTENTGALNTQVAKLDTTKLANQTRATGALSEQNTSNAMKLSDQNTLNLMRNEEFQFPMQKELAKMGYDTSKQIAMATAINSQTNTMMGIVGTLLNNTDVEMGDNVTKWASDYMTNSWQSLGGLFDIPVSVV